MYLDQIRYKVEVQFSSVPLLADRNSKPTGRLAGDSTRTVEARTRDGDTCLELSLSVRIGNAVATALKFHQLLLLSILSLRSSSFPSSSCLDVCPLPSSGRPRMRAFAIKVETLFGNRIGRRVWLHRSILRVRHRQRHPPKLVVAPLSPSSAR